MIKGKRVFNVLVIFGILMTITAICCCQSAAADYEVIVTQEETRDVVMTTFEGGGQNAYINPENDYLIPGTLMYFPHWKTFNQPAVGYTNNPSGAVVAFWVEDDSANVIFDEPVSGISFYYAAYWDINLDAYDDSDTIVGAATGLSNIQPAPVHFSKWDLLELDVGENIITRLQITSGAYYTLIDDFSYWITTVIPPADVVEDTIEDLEELTIPDGAPTWVDGQLENAIEFLEDAQANFENNDNARALQDLSKGVHRLVLIEDEVPGTAEVLDQIIDVTDDLVSSRVENAYLDADSRVDEIRVRLAENMLERAQEYADSGNDFLAMVMYRLAFRIADRV